MKRRNSQTRNRREMGLARARSFGSIMEEKVGRVWTFGIQSSSFRVSFGFLFFFFNFFEQGSPLVYEIQLIVKFD